MPQPLPTLALPGASGGVDVFLSIQSKRAGKIKGESQATDHRDEVAVHGWHWGVAASSSIGASQATARRTYKNLVVSKRIDSATTALLSVLATNDEVREAKLSMRKAGEGQRNFFSITLNNARVIAVELDCDEQGEVIERITFSFTKVQVDYEIQQSTGQRGSGFSFQDEILPV
jgi:type VI secretion system secreted protein Hcp